MDTLVEIHFLLNLLSSFVSYGQKYITGTHPTFYNKRPQPTSLKNKNTRRPKEAHIAQHLKEIEICDRAGEDLKELDQH